jgi:MFS family permease
MGKSIWAVAAAIVFNVVATTLVDIALHAVGVFPPLKDPLSDAQSAIATSYRVVFGIAGAWLTARLAPRNPMKHVMILGVLGTAVGLVGVFVTWNAGLGPHWYPILLAVLAIPQSWVGGRLAIAGGAAAP